MTRTSDPTPTPTDPGPTSTPDPGSSAQAAPPPLRRRAAVLAALLTLTLSGAVAARVLSPTAGAGGTPPGGRPGAPGLHFVAPGGGPVHFEGHLDRGAVLEGGDGLVRLELRIRADESNAGPALRVPTDLMVVIDRSGSMSGGPLGFAQAAVRELVAQLGDADRFALVSYASGARVDVPLTPVHAEARPGLLAAVDRIRASGGTNMSGGIDLAVATLARSRGEGRVPRLIVLSDGHANEGDTSFEGLRARAALAVAGEWVLSAVGVGEGFDEALMSALADAGTGNFYYLRHARGLADVFRDELAAARETLASGLGVHLRPGPGVQVLDAAGYPLERDGDSVCFHPGSLFAGQERRVWVSFRVPTHDGGPGAGAGAGGGEGPSLGAISLSYTHDGASRELAFAEPPRVALTHARADFLAAINGAAWEQGVTVDEYNALKAEVARAIRSGDKRQALRDIDDYVTKNRALEQALGSPAVAGRLREAEGLADAVEEAFEPKPSAPARQNELSKKLTVESRDGRRLGAKK